MDSLEESFKLFLLSLEEDNGQRLRVPNNNGLVEEWLEEASEAEWSCEQFIGQISEKPDDNRMINETLRELGESSEDSDCNPWSQSGNILRYWGDERLEEQGEQNLSIDGCIHQLWQKPDDDIGRTSSLMISFEPGESSEVRDCHPPLQVENVLHYWSEESLEEQGEEDLSLQECILQSLQRPDYSGTIDCNPPIQVENIIRHWGGERLEEQHDQIDFSPGEHIRHELQKPHDSGMVKMSIEHGKSSKDSDCNPHIQRVSTHLDDRIKREIDRFHEIKELHNIVQNLEMVEQEDRSCVYINLELCICNLKDFVETPNLYSAMEFWKKGLASIHLVNLMRGIVNGVKCLHQSNIIHRDIKPENILITKTINGELSAKIADVGISKILSEDNASLTWTRHACGTLGWSAPELSERGPHTKAVDIFSLGCVLFYCCTKGKLPFGINENKEKNRKDNTEDQISYLSLIEDQLEARDLIVHLLNNVPNKRPTADQALKHPFFWTAKHKLDFMKDASDRVLKAERNKETALLTAVEGCLNLNNGSWDTNPKWDKRFLQHMFKFPRAKYDKKKVSSLLRIIRNGLVHFNGLPPSVQASIGNSAEAQESHFSSIFPGLLFNVYQVLLYGQFKEDPKLKRRNKVDPVIDKYKWL